MKATQIIVLLVFFLFNHLHAQWLPLNSGVSELLHDIDMVTPDVGYSVGENGTVIKTVDAGETWTALSSPANQTVRSVYFLTENHGFICGEEGLFETVNGGLNWLAITLTGNTDLRHIEFFDSLTGFSTGANYTIYKTVDGGLTWHQKPVSTNGTFKPISDITFPTSDVGYGVCTDGSWNYLKTTDGGESWNLDTIAQLGTPSNLEAIHFRNVNDGFIGGWDWSTFITTNDGGQMWTDDVQLWAIKVHDIDFFDDMNGILAGEQGWVYQTNDGGTTWIGENVHSPLHKWTDVDYDPVGVAYVVGENGQIYKNGSVLSIENHEMVDASVWPNPTSESVNISANQLIRQVEVRDFSGRTVGSMNVESHTHTSIDLPTSKGVYVLQLTFENGLTAVKRVTKK